MKTTSLVSLITCTLAAMAGASSFNHFPAWANTGDASLVDDVAFLTNAVANGTDDAFNFNNSLIDPALTTGLEGFVGLPSGGFALAGVDVTEGSAIRQTFTVPAGESFSFDWEFLTNETSFDIAFIVLDGVFTQLIDSSAATPGASYGYDNSTVGTFTSGVYGSNTTVTLAIGVADTDDFSVSSALRIPTIIPEPSASALACLAALAGFTRRRRA